MMLIQQSSLQIYRDFCIFPLSDVNNLSFFNCWLQKDVSMTLFIYKIFLHKILDLIEPCKSAYVKILILNATFIAEHKQK